MAKPLLLAVCRISSTGSKEIMPNATTPLESNTPRKLHIPDHITATPGVRERV